MTSIPDCKAAMRAEALARRAGGDPLAGEPLARFVLRQVDVPPCAVVAGVWPLPGEMDLRPLLHALHARGNRIVLPQTPPRGERLIFRSWIPGCRMLRERFGTWRPDSDVAEPTLVFVPLLAFDDAGNRLGYGGGYYDRTLQALPHCPAIGFAYAAQRVPAVPMEPHDRPLDMIATERGLVWPTCSRKSAGFSRITPAEPPASDGLS